jgi:hypothetical protein
LAALEERPYAREQARSRLVMECWRTRLGSVEGLFPPTQKLEDAHRLRESLQLSSIDVSF